VALQQWRVELARRETIRGPPKRLNGLAFADRSIAGTNDRQIVAAIQLAVATERI
jgi:hypothetical protein